MVVTDIILLLILLVGLLRHRREYGGTFGLAQLLWKQVRRPSSLTVRRSLKVDSRMPSFRGLSGSWWLRLLRFRQQYVS
jgi:hypothetical protein